MTEAVSDFPVRVAIPQDEENIMFLCHLLHEENGLMRLNPVKVRETIRRALYPDPERRMLALMGVIGEVGGELRGMCCMIVGQMWYSDDHHLEELFCFTHPNHRKAPYGRDLLQFMKKTSDQVGIPLLTGIISNERTAAKVRMYRKSLPEVGAFFLYGGKTGDAPAIKH